MSHLRTFAGWAFVSGVILFAAVHPQAGVVFSNPMAAISLGLIGFGLCKHVRDNITAQQKKAQPIEAHATAHTSSKRIG